MSWMRVPLNLWLRLTEKTHMTRARTPEKLRRSFEVKAKIFFRGARGTRYRPGTVAGVPGLRVVPKGAGEGPLILYFHGGGYIFGSPATHKAMLSQLCRATGLEAFLPDYRKAPEHPFPAAVDDAMAVYRALADHPGGVILGGDSAGGGLALAILGEITRLGLGQPAGVFAFSPLTDMTCSGESLVRNAQAEAILPASRTGELVEMYMGGHDPGDARATPLNAGFSGACPVWLCAGDTEILLDDTRRMAAHLRAQGVAVVEIIEHDLPHVWPIFHTVLPEARATLRQVAAWIRSLSSR